MNNAEFIVQCKDLCKSYGPKAALSNVSIDIRRGKIIGLLGSNGSGKTTFIKLANGLLQPTKGEILIDGRNPGTYTKSIVSYLPERTYLNSWMKVRDILSMFEDFYEDFDRQKAEEMLIRLGINKNDRLKTMSKGTKEKVQLMLVMSRKAQLYLLDEPIAGVDPAARDFIMDTILSNFDKNSTLIISTHLISDIEKILDDVIFVRDGKLLLYASADHIRQQTGMSVDGYFREVYRC
jgi:ABC-2 type transport system ATP-binding protein